MRQMAKFLSCGCLELDLHHASFKETTCVYNSDLDIELSVCSGDGTRSGYVP